MKRHCTVVLTGLMLAAAGCGGGAAVNSQGKILDASKSSGIKTSQGVEVSKQAAADFSSALQDFAGHDKANDWSEATCKGTASGFQKAAETQKSDTSRAFPAALYNAGLAYQRCGMDKDAQAQFQAAVAADANFHRARTQLALYDYQRDKNVDGAIEKLNTIIRDAKFQNAEALVAVATLQMERNSDQSDSDGANDLARALRNIQRALAIDDAFMPAFNQLAIYYLEQAKAKAGAREKGKRRGLVVSGSKGDELNQQMLDLAALVASQAVQKNPGYAAIHNTAGLIQVEQKNYNGAVKSFKRARELDPKFFEAHMNYAAVNLSFRGFQEAEKAYRDALRLRPDEYEAHLGLALALRGEIDPTNFAKNVAESQAELDKAKKLAPDRAETYYNEAILTQEYKAKGGQNAAIPMLEKAVDIYQQFIGKAEGDPAFAEAVKRSKDRVQDIQDTVKFIKEGEEAKRQADADAKASAAAAKSNPPPAAPPAKK